MAYFYNMKTIGLVGGLTWFSSIDYYRYMNQLVNEKLGGDEAARVILNSVNYGEIKRLTQSGRWDQIANVIGEAARQTEKAGANCILLGANTMHHIAEQVQAAVNIPLIHIADATAVEIAKQGISAVALLGTKYTMQFDFYKNKLADHGIRTLVPAGSDIEYVNDSIYNELGKGILKAETREQYQRIIGELQEQGAGGVILGCTEIPLLIKQTDSPLPVFDTTLIHAKAAVEFALA